jgi:putative SOS response-associated peptidase YedK
MFNRYSLTTPERLAARFLAEADQPLRLQPRYSVARGDTMPVVLFRNGAHHLERLRFGLTPSWATEHSQGFVTASAETVAERPSSKDAFRSQRCLIPADSYFAWRTDAARKQPYRFYLADEPLFAFAGIYDRWSGPDGTELSSFAIITCPSNELVAPISEVMPAILRRGDERTWLDPRLGDIEFLHELLKPVPAAQMRSHRVSAAVLSPGNDSPEVIRPLDDSRSDRYFPDLA